MKRMPFKCLDDLNPVRSHKAKFHIHNTINTVSHIFLTLPIYFWLNYYEENAGNDIIIYFWPILSKLCDLSLIFLLLPEALGNQSSVSEIFWYLPLHWEMRFLSSFLCLPFTFSHLSLLYDFLLWWFEIYLYECSVNYQNTFHGTNTMTDVTPTGNWTAW